MPVYNYSHGEINLKIVYYGPGLSGKTTNLEHIYSKLPREKKGKMVSMKTRTDRTLFFDFLPIDVGDINGMKTRFLLYTVPGQVYYNATRKLVLKGVDAVVFVADSAAERMSDNRESLRNLEENLNDLGLSLKEIPWVIQYNKRDLPNCTDCEIMNQEINVQGVPSFNAVATTGTGVYETFEGIAQLVFRKIQRELKSISKQPATEERPSEQVINVEVVAKGTSRAHHSEADEGKSFVDAEKSEEEHESVSEFVDNVLKESKETDEDVDMGATREGYEDYGHLVELKDEEERETQVAPEQMEIISDPLDKPAAESPPPAEAAEAPRSEPIEVMVKEEQVIRIPVHISSEDVEKEIPVKLILEITADKQ